MIKFFNLLSVLLLINLACAPKGKSGAKAGPNNCLTAKMDELSKQSCEKGANIKEYKFMGETVYVFDQGPCGNDMTLEVVDTDCKNLGYLGGITGNKEIKGQDFSSAEFIKTIWEKE